MLLVAAGLPLFAGCLGKPGQGPGDLPARLPLGAEAFPVVPASVARGFEPTIGVTPDGTLYTYGRVSEARHDIIYRSLDGGASWQEADSSRVREPDNLDPFLHVDRQTGRVFHAPLHGACLWLQWTDDGGQGWETNPRGGCGTPFFHFQKLSTGPPAAGVATQGYPNVVYLASMSLRQADPTRPADLPDGGTPAQVTRSLDGGRTFSDSVEVHPLEPGCYTKPGGIAVGPDGTAYSVQGRCNGIRVSRSQDSGASWEPVAMLDEVGWLAYGSAPGAAVHPDGSITLLHHGRDGRAYVRESGDRGATWSPPAPLGNETARTTMFTTLDIDEQGNLFAAFLGTASDVSGWERPITTFAPPSTVWNLFVAARPAGSAQWTVAQVTEDADPVQRGCIWTGGDEKQRPFDDCADIGDAGIGDFIGVASQGGRAWVSYVDSCDACPPGQASTGSSLMVARWGLPGPVAEG